jgi:heme/copper-type cytochrome/quinol oxidase subunit 2
MTFEVEVMEPPEFERWVTQGQERQRGTQEGDGGESNGQEDPQGQALGVAPAVNVPSRQVAP